MLAQFFQKMNEYERLHALLLAQCRENAPEGLDAVQIATLSRRVCDAYVARLQREHIAVPSLASSQIEEVERNVLKKKKAMDRQLMRNRKEVERWEVLDEKLSESGTRVTKENYQEHLSADQIAFLEQLKTDGEVSDLLESLCLYSDQVDVVFRDVNIFHEKMREKYLKITESHYLDMAKQYPDHDNPTALLKLF